MSKGRGCGKRGRGSNAHRGINLNTLFYGTSCNVINWQIICAFVFRCERPDDLRGIVSTILHKRCAIQTPIVRSGTPVRPMQSSIFTYNTYMLKHVKNSRPHKYQTCTNFTWNMNKHTQNDKKNFVKNNLTHSS